MFDEFLRLLDDETKSWKRKRVRRTKSVSVASLRDGQGRASIDTAVVKSLERSEEQLLLGEARKWKKEERKGRKRTFVPSGRFELTRLATPDELEGKTMEMSAGVAG